MDPARCQTRSVEVLAMRHDGSWTQAAAVAGWVSGQVFGDMAYVELVEGRLVVLVLQVSQPEALWVLAGQHLVLDLRRPLRWQVYGAAEFDACFLSASPAAVRELPIFDDGEVA